MKKVKEFITSKSMINFILIMSIAFMWIYTFYIYDSERLFYTTLSEANSYSAPLIIFIPMILISYTGTGIGILYLINKK